MAALGSTITLATDLASGSGLFTSEEILLMERPYMRPRLVSTKLNIPVLIATSMIFITIIMWFEVMRLSIEYSFLNTVKTRKLVLGFLVFAIVMTLVLGGILLSMIKLFIVR